MSVLRGASLALLALLVAVPRAMAADEYSLTPPVFLDDAPPPKPLASLLQKGGLDTSKAGIAIYGFVEGSYTYSASSPPGNFITGRVFDVDHEDLTLNQFDLTIERTVDAAASAKAGKFDVGFRVEAIYGGDARFTHSNGLNFYGGDSPQVNPDEQIDLLQAYVQVAVPVGNGLLIQAGKFVTLLGQEVINPTGNALYSHSYLFGYAIPFTHTGILATYNLTNKLSVTGGITRGWEQALKDNNDSIDFLGEVKYVFFNDQVTAIFNVVSGPEEADNNSDYRTVLDAVVTYVPSAHKEWTFAINGDYGWEAHAAIDGGTAQWYGVALYAGYTVCPMATLNARLEYFNDDDGARGLGGTVYEATLGVALKPFPNDRYGSNLMIRPEVRYDYSDDGIFDGGTDKYQVTAAVDAIYQF